MTVKWDMVGKPISTADMAAAIPTVYQRFRLPSGSQPSFLKGLGLGLIFEAALFTNLTVELWSDRDGLPGTLLATSTTTWTKAQIDAQFPDNYKFSYVGFNFAAFPLYPGTYYHAVVRATGYTGDDTNHIAWRHSYPDNQYAGELGYTVQAIKVGVIPYEAIVIAAEA